MGSRQIGVRVSGWSDPVCVHMCERGCVRCAGESVREWPACGSLSRPVCEVQMCVQASLSLECALGR